MEIKFYNETGMVLLGGGNSASNWRITSADGLLLPEKTFQTARYAGSNGQEITSYFVNARTITMSGDIRITESYKPDMANALAVLEKEGVLEITSWRDARRIGARCVNFTEGERKGCYQLFCIQFVCDDPYFEDCEATEFPVYKVIPHLSASFSLPGTFSTRIARGNVLYEGTAAAEPVFCISTGSQSSNILSITNYTSDSSLKINSSSLENQNITVDVKSRRIYNASGESLLSCLADDSFFDGFWLLPGLNDIEVKLGTHSSELTVSCQYRKKYLEAML